MKHIAVLLLLSSNLLYVTAAGQLINRPERSIQRQLKWVQRQLKTPGSGNVLIAAHRGDWRNAPENSIQSLVFCIEKGFDIVECDLKKSKDGHLIIMHDKTIDRTTTGTGKPENHTLADLKKLRLRNATGHQTEHEIPTLDEFLGVARNKIMVCIDKGFEYFDDALALVDEYNMRNQIIFNVPALTYDSLKKVISVNAGNDMYVNLLSFPLDTTMASSVANSFNTFKNVIFHPVFATDTISFINWMGNVKKRGANLWLNALWPEHNAGHDDDKAVEKNLKDETWGWLIKKGATIIQTDRPSELLSFLIKGYYHPKF